MNAVFSTRPALPADVPELVTLVNSAYRGDSSRAGWTTEADLLDGIRIDAERLRSSIGAEGHLILVHEEGGAIVSCVHLQRTSDGCYLGMLTTAPARQGIGYGRRMLEAAEAWALEHWRARDMELTVIVQRLELIAWYERMGYTRTGQHTPFPYGDERWGLPKRDDLAFVFLRRSLVNAPG